VIVYLKDTSAINNRGNNFVCVSFNSIIIDFNKIRQNAECLITVGGKCFILAFAIRYFKTYNFYAIIKKTCRPSLKIN